MALQWNFKDKCGEAVLVQNNEDKTREFTLNLYVGNAYLIMLSEYEENGENMYSLYSFWADKKHMENCLGLSKGYDNIDTGYQTFSKFRLDMEKCRYWKQIAPAIKKAFPDIVIELY